jgi:hypothetical protein
MNTLKKPANFRRTGTHFVNRLFTGPIRLFKAQFTSRNAVCLVALSVPALLVTLLLTLPALLFTTPQHYEYFEFAQQLDQGGERWLALGLSACCSLFAFAIPAQGEAEDRP